MSELKNLVPPQEMCKLIPSGEFVDSALMWIEVEIPQENKKEWRIVNRTRPIEFCSNLKYPAPTLQEVLQRLKIGVLCGIEHHGDMYVSNRHIGCFEDRSGATAAMKLWFKLKGVEYGK